MTLRRHMDRARAVVRRRPIRTMALGLLALVGGIWTLLFVTKGSFLKAPFERISSTISGRSVTIDGGFELYFDPLVIHFAARGLRISNPSWASKPDLLSAATVDAYIHPFSLLVGRRHFRSLVLNDAAADVEWNARHTLNTWTLGAVPGGEPLTLPVIDTARVSGTAVRYLDPRMPLLADLRLQPITSTAAHIGAGVHLVGTGRFRATSFTLTGSLLSPDATVARGRNQMSMEARAARNVVDVSGTLPSLADFENVPLSVSAHGPDIDDLLAIIGAVVPKTRQYALRATLVKSGEDYRFTDLRGRFGDSDIRGHFTVRDSTPRIRLDAVLATRSLDIVDAAPFIGYNPDTVATKGAVAAAAETGSGPAHVLPNGKIPVQTLRNFDASLHYKIGAVRSKHAPISNVDLTLALVRGLLKFEPLTFDMARGSLVANVTINARREPVRTVYDVTLRPTRIGRLFAGFGASDTGTTGTVHARLHLVGVGDTVHQSLSTADGRLAIIIPSGTLSQRDIQLSELDAGVFAQRLLQHKLKQPVQINCGLVAFTVRRGRATADPILIDTTGNVISGRGGFDFNSETVNLTVKGDGKKFSLFSAQSPIAIGGHFSSPSVKLISPSLIARAGAGLGLAIVATPVAGVLAFVDLGGAKAARCGPILAGASASRQQTIDGKPREGLDGASSPPAHKRKRFLGLF